MIDGFSSRGRHPISRPLPLSSSFFLSIRLRHLRQSTLKDWYINYFVFSSHFLSDFLFSPLLHRLTISYPLPNILLSFPSFAFHTSLRLILLILCLTQTHLVRTQFKPLFLILLRTFERTSYSFIRSLVPSPFAPYINNFYLSPTLQKSTKWQTSSNHNHFRLCGYSEPLNSNISNPYKSGTGAHCVMERHREAVPWNRAGDLCRGWP